MTIHLTIYTMMLHSYHAHPIPMYSGTERETDLSKLTWIICPLSFRRLAPRREIEKASE